ncbi:ABC transporter permease [uncultured Brachyspira sp.]|uniref:ABC transporter permease n=1 Tax=uncultured Brachyspira sp. TaxID=221953 RepID=UPI0025D9246E|nr:ABC transporter permease [uncultured Brachyspira sp.]
MLGVRYLRAKKKFSFVSIITVICVLGILVGDMVMITVLSVMNGFQDDIRDKILGMRAHINISAYGDRPLTDYQYIIDNMTDNKEIISAYPYIVLPCIMRSYNFTILITVRSFEDNIFSTDKDFIKYFNFIEGSNKDMKTNDALIGSEMAKDYALSVGDTIDIISASGSFEKGFRPQKTTFTIKGIYKTGYYEYDSRMVIVSLYAGQKMIGYDNSVTGVAVKVKNFFNADKTAKEINSDLKEFYNVMPWMLFDRNFFQALHTEKLMLALILSFIILIAALNIASSQIIFVKDKRRDIAIIKTLGLRPSNVAKVFFLEGAIIGLIGTVLGVIFGILLANYVNETLEGIRIILQYIVNIIWFIPSKINAGILMPIVPDFFPSDIYYVSGGLPSIVHASQVIMVAGISFLLSVLFAIIPAYIASRYKPAEVLRYE